MRKTLHSLIENKKPHQYWLVGLNIAVISHCLLEDRAAMFNFGENS